jgi:hypothetical protein
MFFRAIVPAALLLTFGWWALVSLLKSQAGTAGNEMKLLLLVTGLLMIPALYWFGLRLKKVAVDDRHLYVSNYVREIAIPLSDIESVSESWLIQPKLIYVRLKAKSLFGRKIVFAPPVRRFSQFRPHPVVDELKQMIQPRR